MVSAGPTKGSAAFVALCWMLVATIIATLNTMTCFGTYTTITILRNTSSLPCWLLAVVSILLPSMMRCTKWCVQSIVRLPRHTANKMNTFIKATTTFFTNWQTLAVSDDLTFSDVCVQWCLFVTVVPFITIAWALFGMAHLLEPAVAPTFKGFNHVLVITNTLLNFALIALLDPFGATECLLRQTIAMCAAATSHDKLKGVPVFWRLLVILSAVSFGLWAEVALVVFTPYLASLSRKWDLSNVKHTNGPSQPMARPVSCPPTHVPVASPPGASTSSSTAPPSRAATPSPFDLAPLDTRANLLGPDAAVDAVAHITLRTNGHRDKASTTAHTTEASEAPAATNTTEESAVGVSLSRASSTGDLSECPSVVSAEPSSSSVSAEPSSSSLAAEASSSSVASSSGSVVGSNTNTNSSVASSSRSNSASSESDAGSSVASSSVARSSNGCVSSVGPEAPRIPPVRCVAGGVHFMREFRLFAEVGALGSRMVAGGVELGSIASFVGKGSESLLSRFVASLPRAPKGAVWGDTLEYRVVFAVAAGCIPQWEVICIHHWAGATPECDPPVSTPQDFLRVCWAAEHFTALLAA